MLISKAETVRAWKKWRTSDGRILPDIRSTFEYMDTVNTFIEFDLYYPLSAPAVLNRKQADALGYQYALLFKMFAKYARYIDHVISWGRCGHFHIKAY